MATNLAIDSKLLEEAQKIGGQRTKRATVNEALKEYIGRRKQQQILELFGKVEFDEDYDHKAQRNRARRPWSTAPLVPSDERAAPSLLGSVRYESEEDLLAPVDEPWDADR